MRVNFVVEGIQRQQHQGYTSVDLEPLKDTGECHHCNPEHRRAASYFVHIPEGQPVPALGERYSLVPTIQVVED